MATWKFKQEAFSKVRSSSIVTSPVAAYQHTDGNIYYACGDGSNVFIQKITPEGIDTNIYSSNRGGHVHEFWPVPYLNQSSGFQEVHFIASKNSLGTVYDNQSTKLILSPTPSAVGFTPAGTLRINNVQVQDFSGNRYVYPVWVNSELYYFYASSNFNYTIQKYSPTLGWQDAINAINRAMPTLISFDGDKNLQTDRLTVFSYGTKIYIMSAIAGYNRNEGYFFFYDTFDGAQGIVEQNTADLNNNLRKWATPFVVGDEVYLIGGQTKIQNTIASTVTKYSFSTSGWADTGLSPAFYFSTPSNAINIGGELLVVGNFTNGVNSNSIIKFTKVLENLTGLTAVYRTADNLPKRIELSWNNSSDESFYIIEKSINGGSYTKIGEVSEAAEGDPTVTFIDQGYTDESGDITQPIDLTVNRYSYRVKSAEAITS